MKAVWVLRHECCSIDCSALVQHAEWRGYHHFETPRLDRSVRLLLRFKQTLHNHGQERLSDFEYPSSCKVRGR